jgi:hypothetical protein
MSAEPSTDLKITGHTAVVLFDPEAGGIIIHVHQVVTMDGAEQPGREELERDARKHASDLVKRHPGVELPKLAKLEALHVDPAELSENEPMRVDVAARKLVHAPHRLRPHSGNDPGPPARA